MGEDAREGRQRELSERRGGEPGTKKKTEKRSPPAALSGNNATIKTQLDTY